jgi:hypothetical protein
MVVTSGKTTRERRRRCYTFFDATFDLRGGFGIGHKTDIRKTKTQAAQNEPAEAKDP